MGEWDIECVCKFLDHINCGQHKDVRFFFAEVSKCKRLFSKV